MRNLGDLSGPWVGFWIQGLDRGEMRLTLRFGETSINGDGIDKVGDFTVSGRYAGEDVEFDKTHSSHTIGYTGRWDGDMIAGRWRFRRRMRGIENEGEFEIWPESDDEAIERMEAALTAVS